MNVLRMSKRMAATGAATALTVGVMIAGIAPAADAATGSSTYTCTTPLGVFSVPVTANLDDLSATMLAGEPIAGGLASPLQFTALADLAAALSGLGLTGLSSPDFNLPFGGSAVPVGAIGMAGLPVPGDAGSLLLSTTGTTGAFNAPEAGTHNITMPASFTMVPSTTAFGDVPVPCTTDAPATLDTVTVTKNASSTVAKGPAKVRKGKVAKLVATVTGGFSTATGKVVFMDGSKKLGTKSLNDVGKAVFKTRGLKVGKHKITAKYRGDGYRAVSRGKTTVKVIR